MTTLQKIIIRAAELVDGHLPVQRVVSAHGGDINENYIVEMGREKNGLSSKRIFLKVQHNSPENFFEAEAEGLTVIQQTQKQFPPPLRTPEVLGNGKLGDSHFLVLEYIPPGSAGSPGSAGKNAEHNFGRQLAMLHTEGRAEYFGFSHDNFIGRTPQINSFRPGWIDFFRECRLGCQIEIAENRNLLNRVLRKQLDSVLGRLDSLLDEPDFPALVHGDLWGGNVITAFTGERVVIDPAVYYGHPEVDIAMTELFGGFSRSFYDGYYEIKPCDPGYGERKDLYNLYHMLNHLNLFGLSYEASVKNIVRKYL